MLLLALLVTLAVLVGLVAGGSSSGWKSFRVRWWPLGVAALAVQVVAYAPPINTQPWAIAFGAWVNVGTLLAVLLVLLRNALAPGGPTRGWWLAALGVSLNLIAMLANGGYMPHSVDARAVAERAAPPDPTTRLVNVAPMTDATRLPWLGDVVPQPAWLPDANVVSVGDLLLASGIALCALWATLSERRAPAAAPERRA